MVLFTQISFRFPSEFVTCSYNVHILFLFMVTLLWWHSWYPHFLR